MLFLGLMQFLKGENGDLYFINTLLVLYLYIKNVIYAYFDHFILDLDMRNFSRFRRKDKNRLYYARLQPIHKPLRSINNFLLGMQNKADTFLQPIHKPLRSINNGKGISCTYSSSEGR